MSTKPKNNQHKKSLKHTHISIVVAVIVVISTLLVVIIPIINRVKEERVQITRLEAVSKDLRALSSTLAVELNVDPTTIIFKNECGQASAVFNQGQITCGQRGKFTQTKDYQTVKADSIAERVIRQTPSFSSVIANNLSLNGNSWSNIDFRHVETDIKCFVSFSGDNSITNHTLGCDAVVSNFLPGYEIR